MQIFLFIYGNDQHRILRVEQLLRQLQPLFHHGQPLAVAIGVVAIHVIVVVLPVLCAGIVGRVDIDAVHLPGVQVLQQLEGVIVVGFDQGMPEVAVRGVADSVNGFQIWIDGIAKLRDAYQLLHRNVVGFAGGLADAPGHAILESGDEILSVRVLPLDGNHASPLHGNVIQQRTLRNVILKHQPKLLLPAERVHFLLNPLPQFHILNLADQIVDRRHPIHPFKTKAYPL